MDITDFSTRYGIGCHFPSSNHTNITLPQNLTEGVTLLGPTCDVGLSFIIAYGIICVLIAMLAVVGNLLVILSLFKFSVLRTDIRFRLFGFLAISDGFGLISLFLGYFTRFFHHYESLCIGFIGSTIYIGVSGSTILTISLERFLAHVAPMWYRKYVTSSFFCKTFIGTVLFYSIYSISMMVTFQGIKSHESCHWNGYINTLLYKVAVFGILSVMFVPLCFMNVLIRVLIIRHNQKTRQKYGVSAVGKDLKDLRYCHLLAVLFIISLMTYSIINVVFHSHTWEASLAYTDLKRTWYISHLLVYGGMVLNPWIYYWQFKEFRIAYRGILSRRSVNEIRASLIETETKVDTSRRSIYSHAPGSRRGTLLLGDDPSVLSQHTLRSVNSSLQDNSKKFTQLDSEDSQNRGDSLAPKYQRRRQSLAIPEKQDVVRLRRSRQGLSDDQGTHQFSGSPQPSVSPKKQLSIDTSTSDFRSAGNIELPACMTMTSSMLSFSSVAARSVKRRPRRIRNKYRSKQQSLPPKQKLALKPKKIDKSLVFHGYNQSMLNHKYL